MSNVVTDKTTIGVILDHELRERLEQAAADNGGSIGAEVRVALRRHLGREHDDDTEEGNT